MPHLRLGLKSPQDVAPPLPVVDRGRRCEEMKARFGAFRQGLEKLGWSEGRNVRIDTRFGAADAEQMQARAKELLALQPDVILANSAAVIRVLQQVNRTIPTVFVAVSDPIGAGLIASLARPGGNFTGLQNYEASITGKWLAMLKEIELRLTRAGLVGDSQSTDFGYFLRASEAVAPSLVIDIVPLGVENAADIERAIDSFARVANGGLVVPPGSTTICIAISSLRWRPGTACLQSTRFVSSWRPAVSCPTPPTSPSSIGRRRPMSTASCAVRSLPTCRCRRRPSSKPWSI